MKNTNNTTKGFKKVFVGMTTAVMMMTMFASVPASAIYTQADTATLIEEVAGFEGEVQFDKEAEGSYNGHEIKDGKYQHEGREFTFKYSDGFFEVDPVEYDAHLATMSTSMAHASCTEIGGNGDYSNGPKKVIDILKQADFDENDIYVSDSYRVKPTADSVACVIAAKDIKTEKGNKKLVSITVRSANYEAEWASNVTLGKTGEAAGFANAADQVIGYFNDFNSDGKLNEALANGDVIFWVHGYSRGGATANLTSKRLIDAYQADGNEVYGYCIAAPQGGVEDAEDPAHNYNSIHNVINPDDLVPYVAPTVMGFKRYGVDHFMFGGEADSYNLHEWGSVAFGNNTCDNFSNRLIDMNVQKARMMKQLENIVPGNTDEYKPYEITAKRLNMPNVAEVVDDDSKNYITGDFINYMISHMVTGTVKIGVNANKPVIDREIYENEMQAPLRRLMMFLNSDNSLPDFMNEISKSELIAKVLFNCPKSVFIETEVVSTTAGSRNFFQRMCDVIEDLFTSSKKTKLVTKLSDESRAKLVDAIMETIDKEAIMNKFENYPTVEFNCEISGREAAKRDLRAILSNVLKSVDDMNDLVTFASNIGGIFKNHSFIQTSAWLRSFDSWYNNDLA